MESHGQSIDSPLVRVRSYIPSSNVHGLMTCHAVYSLDLQVPFESLRRAAKDRKHVVTEVEASLDEVRNANSTAEAPVKGAVYLPDIKFQQELVLWCSCDEPVKARQGPASGMQRALWTGLVRSSRTSNARYNLKIHNLSSNLQHNK